MLNFIVTRIAPHGLGFGDGLITGNPEGQAEVLSLTDEAIHSVQILVAVSRDDNGKLIEDDGCGDGRSVAAVFRWNEQLKRSLNRPKVFGGGVTMAVAAAIGLGELLNKNLATAFTDAVTRLASNDIDFGAHTAEHVANDDDSGCGAIDKAPEIIAHVVHYRREIENVIAGLGFDYDAVDEDLEAIFNNYAAVAGTNKSQPFSGKAAVTEIMQHGKVVKQLAGEHRERRIILNKVRGYTVNQKLIGEVTDEAAQVFAVDMWRLEDIADKLYAYEPANARKALLSEVLYTLGVASILTCGDLPVDVIEATPATVAV